MKIRVFGEPKIEPYTGFIYIWRNSKTGKSYIGSHMGHTGDGYIGSGSHFRKSFNKNRHLFKRRILQYVCGTFQDLITAENKWLLLISKKDKNKYYNQFYTSTGLHKYDYNTIEVMKFAKRGGIGLMMEKKII